MPTPLHMRVCLVPQAERTKGQMYQLVDGTTRKWNGRMFLCVYDRNPYSCKDCRSDGLCEPGRLHCTACDTANSTDHEPKCANESCDHRVRGSPYFPLCAHCFHAAHPDVVHRGWKEKQLHDAIVHPDQWRRRETIQATDGLPVVVIHFNPDEYTHDGVRVAGCFPQPRVVDERVRQRRFAVFADRLRGALDLVPPQTLTVSKLFFDDVGTRVGRWQWPVDYSAIV